MKTFDSLTVQKFMESKGAEKHLASFACDDLHMAVTRAAMRAGTPALDCKNMRVSVDKTNGMPLRLSFTCNLGRVVMVAKFRKEKGVVKGIRRVVSVKGTLKP